MTSKNTKDLSIEELLKAINDNDVNETFTSNDPFYTFIEVFGITDGDYEIKGKLLLSLYRHWNPRHKISNLYFTNNIGKYLVYNPKKQTFTLNKNLEKVVKHLEEYKKPPLNTRIKSKGIQNHFNKFLEEKNIQAGTLYIEADVFYHVYDTWCYRNRKKTILSYRRFIGVCQLFFEEKYFNGSYLPWFAVHPSIKEHISPEAVRNWREGRKRRGKKSFVQEETQIIYPETQAE
jgi:hypothetical protein